MGCMTLENSWRFLLIQHCSTFRQQAAQSKKVQGVVMSFSTKRGVEKGREEETDECLEAKIEARAWKGSKPLPTWHDLPGGRGAGNSLQFCTYIFILNDRYPRAGKAGQGQKTSWAGNARLKSRCYGVQHFKDIFSWRGPVSFQQRWRPAVMGDTGGGEEEEGRGGM